MFDTQNDLSNQTKADQDQNKAGQNKRKVRQDQPTSIEALQTLCTAISDVRLITECKPDKALAYRHSIPQAHVKEVGAQGHL